MKPFLKGKNTYGVFEMHRKQSAPVAKWENSQLSCSISQRHTPLVHTTVLPFIIIEMRTTYHHYPSRCCGLGAVFCFTVGYVLWVCWVHSVTGVWVYPLLERLGSVSRLFFFSCLPPLLSLFYVLGETLNSYIWDHAYSNKIKAE
ncbi:unnamed protein product [Boreogadus saida]